MESINRNSIDLILANGEFASNAEISLNDIYEYASCVLKFSDKMKLLAAKYSGAEYREELYILDRNRTAFHNSAILGLKVLNRISDRLGIPHVYSGNPEEDDRGDIAHVIFQFAKDNFDSDMYGAGWK